MAAVRKKPAVVPAIQSLSCVMGIHEHCAISIGHCPCLCHLQVSRG
jgi:hypothetical protein